MQQATHFIEQYVGITTKNISSTEPLLINFLNESLSCTSKNGLLKTIAVFKIKFKN
jgi:hypothetical protein